MLRLAGGLAACGQLPLALLDGWMSLLVRSYATPSPRWRIPGLPRRLQGVLGAGPTQPARIRGDRGTAGGHAVAAFLDSCLNCLNCVSSSSSGHDLTRLVLNHGACACFQNSSDNQCNRSVIQVYRNTAE